jgi:hypothetical protein
MHVTAMLVLLHGPKEQCLAAARFGPSFPDVLFLLLVLNQMLAFVLSEQDAPIVKLGTRRRVRQLTEDGLPGTPSFHSSASFNASPPAKNVGNLT